MSHHPEPVKSVSRALTQNLWLVLRNSSGSSFLFSSFFFFCLAEDSVSCENPGLPDNGYQILSKRLYLPGESLTFVCYQGYELIGEVAIKCILGNPSFWSGPLPLCRGETFAEFVVLCMCGMKSSLVLYTFGFMHVHNILQKMTCSMLDDTNWSCPYRYAC